MLRDCVDVWGGCESISSLRLQAVCVRACVRDVLAVIALWISSISSA